jgi:hypothetical protein
MPATQLGAVLRVLPLVLLLRLRGLGFRFKAYALMSARCRGRGRGHRTAPVPWCKAFAARASRAPPRPLAWLFSREKRAAQGLHHPRDFLAFGGSMRAKTTPNDLFLSLAVTAVGGVALFLALRARWNPGDMNPGIEGCLTAGAVGFIFALLQPVPYRKALTMTSPVVVVQYLSCVFAGGPAVGVVALQLLIMGFLGLVLVAREARPATAAGELEAEAERATA